MKTLRLAKQRAIDNRVQSGRMQTQRKGGIQEQDNAQEFMSTRRFTCMPAIALSSVVLPLPEGPRTAQNDPGGTKKETLSRIVFCCFLTVTLKLNLSASTLKPCDAEAGAPLIATTVAAGAAMAPCVQDAVFRPGTLLRACRQCEEKEGFCSNRSANTSNRATLAPQGLVLTHN